MGVLWEYLLRICIFAMPQDAAMQLLAKVACESCLRIDPIEGQLGSCEKTVFSKQYSQSASNSSKSDQSQLEKSGKKMMRWFLNTYLDCFIESLEDF